jgi:predicted TIM-barrel fold metal-dependent hydrolase
MIALHIPRSGRLKDPVNLEQMVEIEKRYPNACVVIAHIGRAYCNSDVGNAFEVLAETENMLFDFSANTNGDVMAQLLRAVGPKRVLFGSDLPIVRMRMRRVCEGGVYINLVPPGLYGDVSDDPHMREVTPEEGENLSYFMYEELFAFRRAAEEVGLTAEEVEDVCYGNAVRALSACGFEM